MGRTPLFDRQAAIQIYQNRVLGDQKESGSPVHAVCQHQYPHVRAGRPDGEVPKGLPWVRYALEREYMDYQERNSAPKPLPKHFLTSFRLFFISELLHLWRCLFSGPLVCWCSYNGAG